MVIFLPTTAFLGRLGRPHSGGRERERLQVCFAVDEAERCELLRVFTLLGWGFGGRVLALGLRVLSTGYRVVVAKGTQQPLGEFVSLGKVLCLPLASGRRRLFWGV